MRDLILKQKLEDRFKLRLDNLNSAQREAVEATEGPVMVVAGPGSGKTELLSLRVANIIYHGLARPENILCLTFTETAARNMTERLSKVIGAAAYKVPIRTFHSFCTEIISRYPEHFFEAHRFEAAGELQQNEILENIFKNIKYGHELFGYSEERGYVYFNDVKERIKNFKEAGLKPQEVKSLLDKNKKEIEVLSTHLHFVPESLRSKEAKEDFLSLAEKFKKSDTELGKLYAEYIIKENENNNLSKAKLKLFEKAEESAGETFKFKEERYIQKLYAFCEVYQEYQNELEKKGLFDFNDMIIYVRDRLENNITLRAELEETYQYILVDEFQDTNLAQLNLIKSITANPVLEGRANVFVVGDDDQSIYKFQGAELSNIFNFQKMYKDVQVIVLTDNYRSTQKVLNFSRALIEQAGERLTNTNKNLVKELISKNQNLKEEKSDIHIGSFKDRALEYTYVAKEIERLLTEGVEPDEIAVISRRHKELQEILPYFDNQEVSYNYERKESVFDERHIGILIKICRFLESLVEKNLDEADEMLPEILSYEFLNIERLDVWDISRQAREENKTWLKVMQESEKENIRELAEFLIELSVLAKTTSLEIILDILIGSEELTLSQDEDQDFVFEGQNENLDKEKSKIKSDIKNIYSSKPTLKTQFISKYKEYYFGKAGMEKSLPLYIHFLSSLRVFINALRDYKKGEKLYVADLYKFVELHKDYKVALLNKSHFVGDEKSISLLSAHKSKGLEYEYVFLISLEDNVWKSRGVNNKISLPVNMPFDRALDDEDDFLRLLFVGATRAKHTIYMTHSDTIFSQLLNIANENGVDKHDDKENSKKVLINNIDTKIENKEITSGLQIYNIPPFAKSEKALLAKILEDYKLSPTHLNNFLNVVEGGPRLFLEQNLLMFPQAKSPSAVYGSAMHRAIEDMYVYTKNNNILPAFSSLEEVFEKEIKRGRLMEKDEENLIMKGVEKLKNFYNLKSEEILAEAGSVKTEVNFRNEGVMLEDAHFTGKIDRLSFAEKEKGDLEVKIVDIKTGKAFNDFDFKAVKQDDYENIKKHNYKQQLMFYKVLLEESATYGQGEVSNENFRNINDSKNLSISSGVLSFVDDEKIKELNLDFTEDVTRKEWEDFKKLLVNVYKIIKNIDGLTQIDISKYEKNINGILEFEKDIIEGKFTNI